jgi:hypothetical protein
MKGHQSGDEDENEEEGLTIRSKRERRAKKIRGWERAFFL